MGSQVMPIVDMQKVLDSMREVSIDQFSDTISALIEQWDYLLQHTEFNSIVMNKKTIDVIHCQDNDHLIMLAEEETNKVKETIKSMVSFLGETDKKMEQLLEKPEKGNLDVFNHQLEMLGQFKNPLILTKGEFQNFFDQIEKVIEMVDEKLVNC